MTPLRIMLFLLAAAFVAETALAQQTEKTGPMALVQVKESLLSVQAENAPFGQLLNEISRQAGFKVELSPDVSGKTLTTNFADLEMQRGIQRLLTLISHKNYFIYYGQNGSIEKVEVYGALARRSPTGGRGMAGGRPGADRRPGMRPPSPRRPGMRPPSPRSGTERFRPPVPPTPGQEGGRMPFFPGPPDDMADLPEGEEPPGMPPMFPEMPDGGPEGMMEPGAMHPGAPEEGPEGTPYIPPRSAPVYIPPRH